jgi:hypothetical protein
MQIGQLQRLIDRIFVRRVLVLPRFDADLKEELDKNPVFFSRHLINGHLNLASICSNFCQFTTTKTEIVYRTSGNN